MHFLYGSGGTVLVASLSYVACATFSYSRIPDPWVFWSAVWGISFMYSRAIMIIALRQSIPAITSRSVLERLQWAYASLGVASSICLGLTTGFTALAGDELSFAVMVMLLAAYSTGLIKYVAVRLYFGMVQAAAPALCAIPLLLATGRPDMYVVAALMTILPLNAIGVSWQHSRIMLEVFTTRGRERSAARTDVLTGLMNRRAFEEACDAAPASGPVAAIFIDLDGFKPVNDQYGHTAGDDVLRQVAERLLAVGGVTDVIARVGGDEFALLLTGRRALVAEAFADQLLATISGEYVAADAKVEVTASLGVAKSVLPRQFIGDLVRRSDTAMYKAKRMGRGQVVLFDDGDYAVAPTA